MRRPRWRPGNTGRLRLRWFPGTWPPGWKRPSCRLILGRLGGEGEGTGTGRGLNGRFPAPGWHCSAPLRVRPAGVSDYTRKPAIRTAAPSANRAVTENLLPMLFEEAYRLPDFEGELVTFNSLRVILATKNSALGNLHGITRCSAKRFRSGFRRPCGSHRRVAESLFRRAV